MLYILFFSRFAMHVTVFDTEFLRKEKFGFQCIYCVCNHFSKPAKLYSIENQFTQH